MGDRYQLCSMFDDHSLWYLNSVGRVHVVDLRVGCPHELASQGGRKVSQLDKSYHPSVQNASDVITRTLKSHLTNYSCLKKIMYCSVPKNCHFLALTIFPCFGASVNPSHGTIAFAFVQHNSCRTKVQGNSQK